MPGIQTILMSIVGLLAGALSASIFVALITNEPVSVYLSPEHGVLTLNETFTVSIKVSSRVPVNVFKGILHFDSSHLTIEKIDYNISIADLWAEEPWYSNGDGTLSFIGGTTHHGGFTGDDQLITVTFKGINTGSSALHLTDIRVLQHDGLGTDALVNEPIDALFTVPETILAQESEVAKKSVSKTVSIVKEKKTTDLNGDGQQTIADLSIFMRDIALQNLRSDFNSDGYVSTADLSILMYP